MKRSISKKRRPAIVAGKLGKIIVEIELRRMNIKIKESREMTTKEENNLRKKLERILPNRIYKIYL